MNRRRFLATLALAALVIGSDGCRSRATSSGRVIVLGFDGMDYRVTAGLMARGLMPNFSRLAASGSFTSLATTMPPQSPVAWSSFMTGMDAGGHGIFDFIHRDAAEMTPYLSTTRTTAPRTLKLGGWQLPVSNAKVELLRHGQPFWDLLERHGVPATIIRMPANFPPSGTATRELSGMGTPDLLGTYGTFTFYTSAPGAETTRALSGGRFVTVDIVDRVVRAELTGPDHPYRTAARPLTVPITAYLDPDSAAAKLVVGDEERVLGAGEWSDWVPVDFELMPLVRLRGMCRFYLKQVAPAFELYASPINIDPTEPAMPISTPASYAAELARTSGRFYTQGLAEDTKSLSEHILTRDEFLRQAALVNAEIVRQYSTVLDGFTSGLLFYYFGALDQVSHMMWRARDPGHPAYDAEHDAPYARVIDDLYIAFDRIVGDTMAHAGPDATVIVVSDHGFSSWRRSFHLNTWLKNNGYLAVTSRNGGEDAGVLGHVDWSRTKAYGLGLNGLYINVRGRERSGTVDEQRRTALVEEIRQKLLATIDPATGRPVVSKALPKEQAFRDSPHLQHAPDLIIGYAEHTRVSNESALGGVTTAELVNNTQEWSGDHCMDPAVVPGVLLTSRPLRINATSLDGVARAVLAEFGITGFPGKR
jgi:predicted AlkP superfamily phosphohydrolase/phosphomutase